MDKKHSYFNLEETLKIAVEHFASLDSKKIARNAGVELNKEDCTFIVPFINQNYLAHYPNGKVIITKGKAASIYLTIIILHYLITADGTPLTGQWIAYRHLPGGDIYNDPFQKRAVTPFLKTFGDRPENFKKAAIALGGSPLVLSGISVAIPVLPRVPICFTIWPGDEEMPASANILFDQSAHAYLPTEDYAHLPAIVTGAMKEHMSL